LRLGRTGMHYVTHSSHRMQKHKYDITCPGALLMETALGPLNYERKCIDVSRPERTGMHYVTHRPDRMQKHKFSITCPSALFVKSVPVPPEYEK
jgi:hypothetical protein